MSIHPLHPKDEPHMTGITWQHRLDTAHSEAQVLAVAREFLSQFGPLELDALPGACRPPEVLGAADDISVYAFELVRRECMQSEFPDVGRRLARFFSHASARLAQMRHGRSKAGHDERESA
jgi:hypothetical protein